MRMKRAPGHFGAERLIALGIGMVCIGALAAALQYPLGTVQRPGAGFFPQLVGMLGLVLSLAAVVFAPARTTLSIERPAVVFIAALLAFCGALNTLGFVVAGVLFTALLARLLGARGAGRIGAIGIITPIVLYLLFTHGFGIVLPRGILAGLS